jgi:hypothetical protein
MIASQLVKLSPQSDGHLGVSVDCRLVSVQLPSAVPVKSNPADLALTCETAKRQAVANSSNNDRISPFESMQRVLKRVQEPQLRKFSCLFKQLTNCSKQGPAYPLEISKF